MEDGCTYACVFCACTCMCVCVLHIGVHVHAFIVCHTRTQCTCMHACTYTHILYLLNVHKMINDSAAN